MQSLHVIVLNNTMYYNRITTLSCSKEYLYEIKYICFAIIKLHHYVSKILFMKLFNNKIFFIIIK